MIKVNVQRDTQGCVKSFQVRGHAGLAEAGNDIVCAAVSILIQNGVNSVEALLKVNLPAISREGLIECEVPSALDDHVSEQVQLLLESMIYGLHSLAIEYPKHVNVVDNKAI